MLNETKQSYTYFCFGLNIESDYELPELIKTCDRKTDVVIKIDDLSCLWKELSTPDYLLVVKENHVLFKIEELATFCIQDGKYILVSPEEGADIDRIRLFLLGSCMGALLMQRNTLCLHGSAVEIDGKAYAITGHSGAGKSTLATAFLNKNYRLLTDDVIVISYDVNNQPMVVPAYPQQKLWQESLENFGIENKGYQPLFERENKFSVPVQNFTNKPIPFAGMIELSKSEDKTILFQEVKGLERIHTVMRQTFRRSFIQKSERTEWHFKEAVKLVNSVSILSIERPSDRFTANELVSLILASISQKEEVVC
jgi:ABC-type cobalamin/Fe3+-siderophores transport system ATPase subunit